MVPGFSIAPTAALFPSISRAARNHRRPRGGLDTCPSGRPVILPIKEAACRTPQGSR
nr:MAG TPA: hypothetical protein [Bacteriophage sp.]